MRFGSLVPQPGVVYRGKKHCVYQKFGKLTWTHGLRYEHTATSVIPSTVVECGCAITNADATLECLA